MRVCCAHIDSTIAEVNGSSDPVFPFALRPAALTVTKSSRLGLAGSDEDWDIMPPGEGVIYIPEHDMHYLISQYHQLHCLRNFREYILAGAPLNTLMYGHIDHCLGYLRQMVMCAADSSLEPASHRQRAPDGTIKSVITGVDIVHQCRDWSQLDEYARANYARYKETFNLGNTTSSASSSGVM